MVFNIFIFFSIILSTWFLVRLLIPYLRKYFIDKPNNRSSHIYPKPRAGGISFVIIISLTGTFLGNYQPLFCLPLAFVSLLDDLRGSPKILRYIFQLLTVAYLMFESNFLLLFVEFFSDSFTIIFLLFLLLFGTAVINFINFMDGIDGISFELLSSICRFINRIFDLELVSIESFYGRYRKYIFRITNCRVII